MKKDSRPATERVEENEKAVPLIVPLADSVERVFDAMISTSSPMGVNKNILVSTSECYSSVKKFDCGA